MERIKGKELHPYYKTGIHGWFGEEVDDNDYILCPICGEVLGMNYWDYSAENDGDNKCPKCGQELDYSEIYEFEDTCYFEQLLQIKDYQLALTENALELARKDFREMYCSDYCGVSCETEEDYDKCPYKKFWGANYIELAKGDD